MSFWNVSVKFIASPFTNSILITYLNCGFLKEPFTIKYTLLLHPVFTYFKQMLLIINNNQRLINISNIKTEIKHPNSVHIEEEEEDCFHSKWESWIDPKNYVSVRFFSFFCAFFSYWPDHMTNFKFNPEWRVCLGGSCTPFLDDSCFYIAPIDSHGNLVVKVWNWMYHAVAGIHKVQYVVGWDWISYHYHKIKL